jgi:hypothetical protein
MIGRALQNESVGSAIRISESEWLSAPLNDAIIRFSETPVFVPTEFRMPMVTHSLAPSLPAPTALRHLTVRLRGRLVVTNPVGVASVGSSLADAATQLIGAAQNGSLRSIIHEASADTMWQPASTGNIRSPSATVDARAARSRRRARLLLEMVPAALHEELHSYGTARVAVALYESTAPSLRVEILGGATEAPGSNVRIDAEIGYRFAIVVSRASLPDWSAVDDLVAAAPARAWPPNPWFSTQRLVPDTWITAHADAESRARWARVTGRAGDRDAYWFPESWERFLESGVHVGHLTPLDMWRPRRPRRSVTTAAFDPTTDRGVCVPPGYGYAECRGTLTVSIVVL